MTTLTLDTLEGHDPHAPNTGAAERWFCCPLPKCQRYPVDPMSRVLLVNVKTGVWCCNRCNRTGVLAERCASWKPAPRAQPAKEARPAPQQPPAQSDWTPEDQCAYEVAQAEIAEALRDGDLIDWLARNFGCLLSVDERGKLRAKDAIKVPVPVRAVVLERQDALVAAMKAAAAGGQRELQLSDGEGLAD